MSVNDLETKPFDLEACFTLIDQQFLEAKQAEADDAAHGLYQVYIQLAFALAGLLNKLEYETYRSKEFLRLGEIILSRNAAVLTFNYDLIIERAIQSASGLGGPIPTLLHNSQNEQNEVLDEELAYSHFRWNLPLVYGVHFCDVRLQRAGLWTEVPGERFYAIPGNDLYPSPVLKLHGSLNWYQQTSQRSPAAYPDTSGATLAENPEAGHAVLLDGNWEINALRGWNGWSLAPLIITPQQNKNFYHPIFRAVWQQAYSHLKECRKLVVGGYSFPPTDFHVRKLFLEAFADHSLEELIVINPDTSVIDLVRTLCHFNKPVIACRDLKEFLTLSSHPAESES